MKSQIISVMNKYSKYLIIRLLHILTINLTAPWFYILVIALASVFFHFDKLIIGVDVQQQNMGDSFVLLRNEHRVQ